MAVELSLRFPDPAQVVVRLDEDGETSDALTQPFKSPLGAEAQKDLHWYLEVYPVQYTTEIDDRRAEAIAAKLKEWGADLFRAVFGGDEARRLLNRFQDNAVEGRLLTIGSSHPAILGQPWELLSDPGGTYLFLERPRISVRRRLSGAGGGRRPFQVQAKDRVHLLFTVSRPEDAGFIDPRADPQAVMDAIERRAPGRVTVEFLRPATIGNLLRRLEDEDLPPVDVLHFDGHGAFDREGRLAESAKQAALAGGAGHLLRDGGDGPKGSRGYLLFERDDARSALVAAEQLGDLLHRQQVGLVVLSACQSATVGGGEDAMGSVAARLTHAGLPSVLAMTQSVLVATTRELFGHFYGELARGRTVGTALDNARRELYARPERGQRQRPEGLVALSLQDWFVPALYQVGRSTPLLTDKRVEPPASGGVTDNLREVQEAGFHGRRRELWSIERWFVGGTRRAVVSGFGGQGKTYLAEEAGRWLRRAGMFKRVCFVGYASFQGTDAVGYAVSTLATVLAENLLDAEAAATALQRVPTLLILDNLEALAAGPLNELLDAATGWSEKGASRVLVTTRPDGLAHAGYPREGSNRCRHLVLRGLAEDDALDWFQDLMRLPPEPQVALPQREAVRELFGKVGFHPLSIGILARQLKVRRIAELGERLEALLVETRGDSLLASLDLSLERLEPSLRQRLPHLGVFEGGAFEDDLMAIVGLEEAEWRPLRQALEQAGLIQTESVPGYAATFICFHPTFAPAMWARLSADERASLTARHQERYYITVQDCVALDREHVAMVRAVVQRELSNLLAAARGALEIGEPWAVEFASLVARFLDFFGRTQDRADLSKRVRRVASEPGSDAWLFARRSYAEELYDGGRYHEAEVEYYKIVAQIGETHAIKKIITLELISRCQLARGQGAKAEATIRGALTEAESKATPQLRSTVGHLWGGLGDVFYRRHDPKNAEAAHETSLAIAKELGDERSVAVSLGQLGSIALEQGDFVTAETRHLEAIETFQMLGEPREEAASWHQLGLTYEFAKRWGDAERAYREAARIKENLGKPSLVASSWHQLGMLADKTGKLLEAEAWYRKALSRYRIVQDQVGEARSLYNLSKILQKQPGRLSEARSLAEQELKIKSRLDHVQEQIWHSYSNVAGICVLQGDVGMARWYRRQERDSYATTSIAQETLRASSALFVAVVDAVADPAVRPSLEVTLAELDGVHGGLGGGVAAFRRILDGARDEDALCDGLDNCVYALGVRTVLRGIADPTTLDGYRSNTPADERVQDAERAEFVREHVWLISGVVAVVQQPELQPQLDPLLGRMREQGWGNLVGAIQRMLDGERDVEALNAHLDASDRLIVATILTGLEDPAFLQALLDSATVSGAES